VKTASASGKYKYTAPETGAGAERNTDRFAKIFKDTVRSAKHSGNIIVVKTLTGCANAACEAIDSLEFPHILGTIAGDSTIFIIADDAEHAPELVARFEDLISK
jgi:transcriptional regulator of arginine metabolism